jgi:hypothetical protein
MSRSTSTTLVPTRLFKSFSAAGILLTSYPHARPHTLTILYHCSLAAPNAQSHILPHTRTIMNYIYQHRQSLFHTSLTITSRVAGAFQVLSPQCLPPYSCLIPCGCRQLRQMGLEGSFLQRAVLPWLQHPAIDVMANSASLVSLLVESPGNQAWTRSLGRLPSADNTPPVLIMSCRIEAIPALDPSPVGPRQQGKPQPLYLPLGVPNCTARCCWRAWSSSTN